jgi:hypothetical protein
MPAARIDAMWRYARAGIGINALPVRYLRQFPRTSTIGFAQRSPRRLSFHPMERKRPDAGAIVETDVPARLDTLWWSRFHTLVIVASTPRNKPARAPSVEHRRMFRAWFDALYCSYGRAPAARVVSCASGSLVAPARVGIDDGPIPAFVAARIVHGANRPWRLAPAQHSSNHAARQGTSCRT